jgi:transposase InsO family protein
MAKSLVVWIPYYGSIEMEIELDDGAVRWLTYPKCPKMNAHAQRFHRTLQEEFIEFHKDLLFEDLDTFNDKPLDYRTWFNESRPHYALGLWT